MELPFSFSWMACSALAALVLAVVAAVFRVSPKRAARAKQSKPPPPQWVPIEPIVSGEREARGSSQESQRSL